MFELDKIVRPNILSLKPYSSARDEFKGKEGIFLDANENPFGSLNRYPDPYQSELKQALSSWKNVPIENIFIGNGSDEVIDLAFRIFCIPGKDKVVICPPTYGMYEVSAGINDVEVIKINLTDDFQLNSAAILNTQAKILFICSPNNPTGNSFKNIETIVKNFRGIVFVDEAYIDFSREESFISKVNQYPNLIVSQTFSKAWGKAAIRVGTAYAGKDIIALYNKVKPPYNVSSLNQNEALSALKKTSVFEENINTILAERKWLEEELYSLNFVKKIHPSDANFLLIEMEQADEVFNRLIAKKIITRNRSSVIKNNIRITVGTPGENQLLIKELRNLKI